MKKGYFKNVVNESYLQPRGEADQLMKTLERKGFYSGSNEARIKFSNLAHTMSSLLGGSLHEYKLNDRQRDVIKQMAKLLLTIY
jgi:hypothetical protein